MGGSWQEGKTKAIFVVSTAALSLYIVESPEFPSLFPTLQIYMEKKTSNSTKS
jgi:hypothetical protein